MIYIEYQVKLQIVSLSLQIAVFSKTTVSTFLQIGFNLYANPVSPFLQINFTLFTSQGLLVHTKNWPGTMRCNKDSVGLAVMMYSVSC